MKFGTYMLIGSLLAGTGYGGYVREQHARCPKERFEVDWTMVQIAVVWPGVFIVATMLPSSMKGAPKRACREDF